MRPVALAWLLVLAAPIAASAAPKRLDDAARIPIQGLKGSLQNACWSPDGKRLAITHWTRGYNRGPAIVRTVSREGALLNVLSTRNVDSVNMPGSCWVKDSITFSAELNGPDSIYTVDPDGDGRRRVARRAGHALFEPTFSGDGQWIVFESHTYDVEDAPGELWKVRWDGRKLQRILRAGDNRQPSWSPRGDRIVFQRLHRSQWDLYTIRANGQGLRRLTRTRERSETDAGWSPSGRYIVYSGDAPDIELANLFTMKADGTGRQRLTRTRGWYDGAPAWSYDGSAIAFEARAGEPDGSPGTKLWMIDAPPGRR